MGKFPNLGMDERDFEGTIEKTAVLDFITSTSTNNLEAIIQIGEGLKRRIVEPTEESGVYRGLQVMKQRVDENYNQAIEDFINKLRELLK